MKKVAGPLVYKVPKKAPPMLPFFVNYLK